jgi:hypothetical protein
MTSILLCHFPGGGGFGIIAPCAEAMLQTSILDQSLNPRGEAAGFAKHDQWLAMPVGHDHRAHYHKAKYMPSKRPAPRRQFRMPERYIGLVGT